MIIWTIIVIMFNELWNKFDDTGIVEAVGSLKQEC